MWKVDVYAFAIIICELMTHRQPWSEIKDPNPDPNPNPNPIFKPDPNPNPNPNAGPHPGSYF